MGREVFEWGTRSNAASSPRYAALQVAKLPQRLKSSPACCGDGVLLPFYLAEGGQKKVNQERHDLQDLRETRGVIEVSGSVKNGLRRCGFNELRPDQQLVLVRSGRGPNGLMASDLRPEKSLGRSLSDTN
jgi:hypothetical protein